MVSPNKLKFIFFPLTVLAVMFFGYFGSESKPTTVEETLPTTPKKEKSKVTYNTPYNKVATKPTKEKVITITKGDGTTSTYLPSTNPYKDLVPSHPFAPGMTHPSTYKSKPIDRSLPPEQRYKGNKYFQTLAKQMQEMKKNQTLTIHSGAGLRAPLGGSDNDSGAGEIQEVETDSGPTNLPRNFAGDPDLVEEGLIINENAQSYSDYVKENFSQERIEEENQRLLNEEYEEEEFIEDDPALIYERELERQSIEEEEMMTE